MMKSISLLAGAALLAVSAISASAPAFAEGSFSNPSSQKCATAQEEMAGRQIADSLSERIRDTAPAQSKRLIKIEGCQVSHGVVKTYFTYNYLAEKTAYAVEGQAVVDAAGAVTLAQVEKPDIVFASIDSNYVE